MGNMPELVSSIAEIGQIQPIAVKQNGKGLELVAGLRRLTACRELKRDVLAMVVDPGTELIELDMQLAENLKRKDFDVLELGEGLSRRKVLYEAKHPEAKHGGPREGAGRPAFLGGKAKGKGKIKSPKEPLEKPQRFTKATAAKLGIAETKVKEALQLASLPRREKLKIEKAGGTSARNKAAQEALRGLRVSNKRARLEAAAADRAEGTGVDPTQAAIVLHHMDNRDFFKAAKEVKFDVVLTDPPYETDRQSIISHTRRSSIKTDFGAWDKLDVGWVALAAPLLEAGGHLLAFSPLEAIGDYQTICKALELNWHGAIIWKKSNPGTVSRPVYLSSVEAIIWATKPGAPYHFEPFENAGSVEAHNFVEGPICGGNERLNHPTQKPEWLVRRLLQRHTHQFSHVLDPFAGVGTTLAVCQTLGIRCTGVELDADYVIAARLRLAAQFKGE